MFKGRNECRYEQNEATIINFKINENFENLDQSSGQILEIVFSSQIALTLPSHNYCKLNL